VTSSDPTPIGAAIAALSGDAILRFLAKQRWFAAKGASPASARIAGVVVMPWGSGEFAIARVTVSASDGDHQYQLPLALRRAALDGVPDAAVVDTSPGGTTAYDAVHDPAFRRGLANAMAVGATATGADGVRWIATSENVILREPERSERRPRDRFRAKAVELPTGIAILRSLRSHQDDPRFEIPSRVGSAEQSNTSIVFDDAAIYKLFRTLKPGVHPDVEVTRFLTGRAAFQNTPALLATTSFEGADGVTTSGMLQAFLPGSVDAWSHALERGTPYFAAPAKREVPNAFVDDATRLGAVTRAMHDALASDDDDPSFAPEPATPEDLDAWAVRIKRSARDALALLQRQLESAKLPKARAAEAQALVRREDQFLAWIDELDETLGDDLGMRIRVHGDFHLGQVLRSRDGDFNIIDFEGEPSRSLDERREKTSPLRDVAGMLRSFAYAAATLSLSVEKTLDMPTRELRSARWERDVRSAYLAGYLGQPEDDAPDILPEETEHVHQLISLFEAEKAFYELGYELNNRPEWVWIPMRGISKLFTRPRASS
jgi:maltose alpha-D-glucosyltransferase/alpha-amylase